LPWTVTTAGSDNVYEIHRQVGNIHL